MKKLSNEHMSYFKTYTVGGAKSLIEKMLNGRRNREGVSMNILKTMLKLATQNRRFFNFMSGLPTSSYLYANFHEWVPGFIEYYKEEMQRYCLSF